MHALHTTAHEPKHTHARIRTHVLIHTRRWTEVRIYKPTTLTHFCMYGWMFFVCDIFVNLNTAQQMATMRSFEQQQLQQLQLEQQQFQQQQLHMEQHQFQEQQRQLQQQHVMTIAVPGKLSFMCGGKKEGGYLVAAIFLSVVFCHSLTPCCSLSLSNAGMQK